MIIWLTGNTGSGKTTLARQLKKLFNNSIILDGDEIRKVWTDLGFSKQDRIENNLRVARLAKNLDKQCYNVIVSVIAPYELLRKKIKSITKCIFIYLPSKNKNKDSPYEVPKKPDFIYYQNSTRRTNHDFKLST